MHDKQEVQQLLDEIRVTPAKPGEEKRKQERIAALENKLKRMK